ncbi:MAG: hypothetical protein ABIG43_01580 [Chloroflexota bacterium]
MIRIQEFQSRDDGDPGEAAFRVFAGQFPAQFGMLETEGIPEETRPINFEEDESGHRCYQFCQNAGLFVHKRKPVRHLFRAALQYVLGKHRISFDSGVDVGSGPTGEMVNEWLPLTDEQRRNWLESDVNSHAVQANRVMHPNANVQVGSMYDLVGTLGIPEGTVPLVTGLSSLDAPDFIDDAVKGIRDLLASGGYLVHVQDVRPGIQVSFDELVHEGEKFPLKAALAIPPQGITMETFNPHVYQRNNGTLVSTTELFSRRLGRALSQVGGFKVLQNNWICAFEPSEDGMTWVYVMNMRAPVLSREYKNPMNLAYAVVTVAKKK